MGKSSSLRRIEDTTTWERFTASVSKIGHMISSRVSFAGNLAVFSLSTLFWLVAKGPRRETLTHCFYFIGVLSIPVVMLTGTFIGMVLAVQAFPQFKVVGLETHIGAAINLSLVKELGPVLAATMLAGRVGSAIAAELGTMRVTEQIDALTCMGTNPIHYLVVPRFLGCLLLIPILALMADFMGIVGGAFYSVYLLGIDSHFYISNSQSFVGLYDISSGIFKSFFFGGAIGVISCYRGFNCRAGAEGVGRAATEAFVNSFVAILLLDLLMGIFLEALYSMIWAGSSKLF